MTELTLVPFGPLPAPPYALEALTVFNVKDFGAKGDGRTDDTVACQAAANAASTVGGIAYVPAGSYKVSSLDLSANVRLVGAGPRVSILVGTTGSDLIVLPVAGGNSYIEIASLGLSGGNRGIVYTAGATADYCTYVTMSDVEVSGPTAECIYTEGAIEEWYLDNVRLSGGTYGFRHANVNNSAASNYVDKCTFKDVTTTGQSEQGWRIEALLSNNVTWLNPIISFASKHGFYADGGVRGWTFVNANTESNGSAGKANRTTGTVSSSSTSLAVASATGYTIGDSITIAGAGSNGTDLTTTVTNVSGTTLTIADAAATAVTSAAVTNAIYDDFQFASTIAGSAQCQWIGGIVGSEGGSGHLRYAVCCQTSFGFHGTKNASDASVPVYDKTGSISAISPSLAVRIPATITADAMQATLLVAGTTSTRGQITSPNGKNFTIAMRDTAGNGTGTVGTFEIRRYDSNRTQVLTVAAKGPVTARGGFTMKTKAGVPTDSDFEATPGDGTLVIDTTDLKIYVRIGGAWKAVTVA